jgi:hypothetical protein
LGIAAFLAQTRSESHCLSRAKPLHGHCNAGTRLAR